VKPVILIAHSMDWLNAARLSIEFKKANFAVEVVAPENHPVHKMRSPDRTHLYRTTRPTASLRQAIEKARPQLIIPCDDRVTFHLHALHAEGLRAGDGHSRSLVSLIERSLGSPQSFELLRHRQGLQQLADLPAVNVPRIDGIRGVRDLVGWVEEHGLPAVLKLDASDGGRGVVIVTDRNALASSFASIRRRQGSLLKLKNALWHKDVEPLIDHVRDGPPKITVQAFVDGRAANCSVACWEGRVLASIAVEIVQTNSIFGISTVVRPVAGQAMIEAARSIVAKLSLSGMVGFDFIIDAEGKAHLIEINPRATQINHLCVGDGKSLPAALHRALTGEDVSVAPHHAGHLDIALFPGEWRRDPKSQFLRSAYHDVPLEEPTLLAHYGFAPLADAVSD
jgi:hypothetical protein